MVQAVRLNGDGGEKKHHTVTTTRTSDAGTSDVCVGQREVLELVLLRNVQGPKVTSGSKKFPINRLIKAFKCVCLLCEIDECATDIINVIKKSS